MSTDESVETPGRDDALPESEASLREEIRKDREAYTDTALDIQELRAQYEILRDNLNGIRLWNIDLNDTLGAHRRTLDRVEEAARNIHHELIEHKATMARSQADMEARLRKLEGGGDVDPE